MNYRNLQESKLLSNSIRVFVAFAEQLNFTRTAEQLHISQSAVHKTIQRLEAELGVALYKIDPGSKRVVALTRHGERLAAYGEDAYRRSQAALADIARTASGPTTIAAGRGAFLYVIPSAARTLSEQKDGIRVVVADNENAIDQVRQGRADVAIVAFIKPPTDLVSQALATFSQTLVVRASHGLARRRSVNVSDLEGIHLALPERGHPMREYLEGCFQAAGVAITVASEALPWDVLVHLVVFGIEATIVNEFVPVPEDLTKVPIRDLSLVTYYAVWRSERSIEAERFIEACDEHTVSTTHSSDVAPLL